MTETGICEKPKYHTTQQEPSRGSEPSGKLQALLGIMWATKQQHCYCCLAFRFSVTIQPFTEASAVSSSMKRVLYLKQYTDLLLIPDRPSEPSQLLQLLCSACRASFLVSAGQGLSVRALTGKKRPREEKGSRSEKEQTKGDREADLPCKPILTHATLPFAQSDCWSLECIL